jgi:hypothetical protein
LAGLGGERLAALAGHSGTLWALAAVEDRLLSSSDDGTIRAWALGTWAALRRAAASGGGAGLYPGCLAVSGGCLVGWSRALSGEQREVLVWGLAQLNLRYVAALVVVHGEV